jgi:hypothetical protein
VFDQTGGAQRQSEPYKRHCSSGDLLAKWRSSTSGQEMERILERLRQDMVRRLTTARLRMELAARRIAAGADVSTMVQTSRP